jgi:hypothetical protein
VGVQEHAEPASLALDLVRFYGAAAHDAGAAGSSAGPRHTIDGGQAGRRQPGAYLPPQFVIGDG